MDEHEIDSLQDAERWAWVLPKVSDLEVEPAVRTSSIQDAINNLLVDSGPEYEEEVFDVALGVRVSRKTANRIDYFSQRFGMTKAVFLRQLLNERLTDIAFQMYSSGLLEDIKSLLGEHSIKEPIDEADYALHLRETGHR